MKLTVNQLRNIIREEVAKVVEARGPEALMMLELNFDDPDAFGSFNDWHGWLYGLAVGLGVDLKHVSPRNGSLTAVGTADALLDLAYDMSQEEGGPSFDEEEVRALLLPYDA